LNPTKEADTAPGSRLPEEEALSYTIAVAGKGGTGKTTISSLVVRHFVRAGRTPVFAVDADSNFNLNDQLGVAVASTIGGSREEMKRKINANEAPAGMAKDEWMEIMMQATSSRQGFDLLVMGRPEGRGATAPRTTCCGAWGPLGNYPVIVIDNEAGMEHLSRRTTAKIDLLLLVSEPSPIGIMTAARIRDLAREMEIQVARIGLVINRVPMPREPWRPGALACGSAAGRRGRRAGACAPAGLPLRRRVPAVER
jgi:CO dehydrogenase maturation factor